MQLRKLARVLFASGLAGLGALSLLNGDFAMDWQPVPPGIPLRLSLAYLSGGILVMAGIGLLWRRTFAAWVLAAIMLTWLLLLQVPRILAHPLDAGDWLGLGENMITVTGGWTLCIFLSREKGILHGFWTSDQALRVARSLYALLLPVIGFSHFKYAGFTAQMVPSWLPARLDFAYLTGAGHMTAGLGILIGVWPRLAAVAEATMISLFVLLLHLPGTISQPGSRLQWTMLCIATAYVGATWAIASGLADRPWFAVAGLTRRLAAPDSIDVVTPQSGP